MNPKAQRGHLLPEHMQSGKLSFCCFLLSLLTRGTHLLEGHSLHRAEPAPKRLCWPELRVRRWNRAGNELSAEPVREKTSSLLVLSHPASAVAIPHQLRNMLSTIISPCTTRCPVSTTLVPAEGINSHATLSDINFWFSNSIGRCYFSTVTSGYFCTHVTDGFEVKVTQDIKRL